jgi:hypothetical protein
MSYARFTTEAEAQQYADFVQSELSKNSAYVAQRWSEVRTGSDGAYYVYVHPAFAHSGESVNSVPSNLDEITDGY